jgi:exosortase/archaeosortase family protein
MIRLLLAVFLGACSSVVLASPQLCLSWEAGRDIRFDSYLSRDTTVRGTFPACFTPAAETRSILGGVDFWQGVWRSPMGRLGGGAKLVSHARGWAGGTFPDAIGSHALVSTPAILAVERDITGTDEGIAGKSVPEPVLPGEQVATASRFTSWLQAGLQHVTVTGAELLLHGMNVRVWADGMVLRTGTQHVGVADASAGMRSVLAVCAVTLGVGAVLRLKWYQILLFLCLGLAQMLGLNILRVTYVVVSSPRMPPDWPAKFLRDSLRWSLFAGVLLTQIEMVLWCWWYRYRIFMQEAVARKQIEPKERASIVPHPLRRIMAGGILLGVLMLVGVGTFAIAYKTRSYHRKEMIREVAGALLEVDALAAERAVREARRWFPDDRALLSLHAGANVRLGRFEEALQLLDLIVSGGNALSVDDVINKSLVLRKIGEWEESRRLVDSLHQVHERNAKVAMLRAEFAAMDQDPAGVAHNVVIAARSRNLLPRVRALFPYLARHAKWSAIAAADRDAPYRDVAEGLIALQAYLQTDHDAGLMRAMRFLVVDWPDDVRLMGALYEMATRYPGGEWERHFEANLRTNLFRLHADVLCLAADYCWALRRPDLAWLVYWQLENISPGDPAFLFASVEHGGVWLDMRRNALGIAADMPKQGIRIQPVLDYLRAVPAIGWVRESIPHFAFVTTQSMFPARTQEQLEASLAALARREAEGALCARLARLYPSVLVQLGQFDEAHRRLNIMQEVFPVLRSEMMIKHAHVFADQQRWADAYEALLSFRTASPQIPLEVALLEIGVLMSMNMAVAAVDRLAEARALFPGAGILDVVESAIWEHFGHACQALHVLEKRRADDTHPLPMLALLEKTFRQAEAGMLRASLGFPRRLVSGGGMPWLPAADLVYELQRPSPANETELAAELAWLRTQHHASMGSPFVGALRALQIAWLEALRGYLAQGVTSASVAAVVAQWEAVGRNDTERAVALYQLGLYAARQRDDDLARAACARASFWQPGNAAIWRARLGLEGNVEPTLAEAAFEACPGDPEIFLATLVSRVVHAQEVAAHDAAASMVAAAIEPEDRFPVEMLVRSGMFLLDQGRVEHTRSLARVIQKRAGSLLSAYVFLMRAGMLLEDNDLALNAISRAISLTSDKVPFYRALADLKLLRKESDHDLFQALEYLQVHVPGERYWSEVLGQLYVMRGDSRRALTVLNPIVDQGLRGLQVSTVLVAAEAARLEHRHDRAVRILEAAYLFVAGRCGCS